MLLLVAELNINGKSFYKVSTTQSSKYDSNPSKASTITALEEYNPKLILAHQCENPKALAARLKEKVNVFDATDLFSGTKKISGAKNNCFTCDNIEEILAQITQKAGDFDLSIKEVGTYLYTIKKVVGKTLTEEEVDAKIAQLTSLGRKVAEDTYHILLRADLLLGSEVAVLRVIKTNDTYTVTSSNHFTGTVIWSAPITKSALFVILRVVKSRLGISGKEKLEGLTSDPSSIVRDVHKEYCRYSRFIMVTEDLTLNHSEALPSSIQHCMEVELNYNEAENIVKAAPEFSSAYEALEWVESQTQALVQEVPSTTTVYLMFFPEKQYLRLGATTKNPAELEENKGGIILAQNVVPAQKVKAIIDTIKVEDLKISGGKYYDQIHTSYLLEHLKAHS